MVGLSIILRGTVTDRLSWAFSLYDLNKDGCITKEVQYHRCIDYCHTKLCILRFILMHKLVIYVNPLLYLFDYSVCFRR